MPFEAIEELPTDRFDIDVIGLPGMPPSSPGMSGEKGSPIEVLAIDDGIISTLSEY